MNIFRRSLVIFVLAIFATPCLGQEKSYHLGNSLTQDTWPQRLGSVNADWQRYCGVGLQFILDSGGVSNCPSGEANSTTTWPQALNNEYEYFVVQSFRNQGTIEIDSQIVDDWLLQFPVEPTVVHHNGWSDSSNFVQLYENGTFYDLDLQNANKTMRKTRCHDALYLIHQDIQNGIGPFTDLSDMYRDAIHMNLDYGRGLMHNMVRVSIESLPYRMDTFGNATQVQTDYLLEVINRVWDGDCNKDGKVNLLDIGPFTDYLSVGDFDPSADCNNDGVVNLSDVSNFINLLD